MRLPPEDIFIAERSAASSGGCPAIGSLSSCADRNELLRTLLFNPGGAKSILRADPREGCAGAACDWDRMVEAAVREGVAPLLFHQIRRHEIEDYLPPGCRSNLSDIFLTNLKRNLSMIGSLRPVLSAFQSGGIPCIVLKGIVLAERVYPNIGLRGMSDVDLLIRKKDLFRADAALTALGFASRDATPAEAVQNPVGYLASLEYRKAETAPLNLNLHLHWHPVNTSVPATAFVDQIDVDRLWEMSVETEVADCPVRMLCPEHLIIYLCEHALRVGHSFDRLILVCDIFYAIKAFETCIDWDFMIGESWRFNLSRFVYHGLSIVKHHTALSIPDACIARLRPSDLSRGEKYFLKLQFSNRRIRGSSYFIYLAMNRGLPAKLGLIARTLFPPDRILLQRHYLKDAEFSKSLYFLRIREVLSQLWNMLAIGRGKTH